MIALAQSGDTLAAREVVEMLGELISESALSGRGSAPPLPAAASSYLVQACADIAAGMDANLAFNLMPGGRPRKWPHEAKVLGVSIMKQCIENHSTIDDAALEASAAVNRHVDALRKRIQEYEIAREAGMDATIDPRDLDSPWRVFIGMEPLDIETLEPMKSWYSELLNSKRSE
jgi:hypothetical protein